MAERLPLSDPMTLSGIRFLVGRTARLWKRRWRLFLLSTIGLFGHRQGEDWGVSHYLSRPFPGISRRF